jgi:hypothetical protein
MGASVGNAAEECQEQPDSITRRWHGQGAAHFGAIVLLSPAQQTLVTRGKFLMCVTRFAVHMSDAGHHGPRPFLERFAEKYRAEHGFPGYSGLLSRVFPAFLLVAPG